MSKSTNDKIIAGNICELELYVSFKDTWNPGPPPNHDHGDNRS